MCARGPGEGPDAAEDTEISGAPKSLQGSWSELQLIYFNKNPRIIGTAALHRAARVSSGQFEEGKPTGENHLRA